MKKIRLALIFLLFVTGASAQKPGFWQRVYFGGNFGLQLGTVTDIEVSPLAGFRVTPAFSVAAGPSFEYYKDPYFKTFIYGGRAYLRYTLIRDIDRFIPLGMNTGLYAQLENDVLSLEDQYFGNDPSSKGRFLNSTLLFGGGISQGISKRGRVHFTILWVLNDPEFNLYSDPIIRIGFTF